MYRTRLTAKVKRFTKRWIVSVTRRAGDDIPSEGRLFTDAGRWACGIALALRNGRLTEVGERGAVHPPILRSVPSAPPRSPREPSGASLDAALPFYVLDPAPRRADAYTGM
jgi:hypothetical protein